jgi:hypothetical protein
MSSCTSRCLAKPPRISSKSSAAATNTARSYSPPTATSDSGAIFDDTTVAAAIFDRLLHHATVLRITGGSYRCAATATPLPRSDPRSPAA